MLEPPNIVFLVGFVIYVGIRHVYQERTKGEEKVLRRIDGLEKALLAPVVLGGLLLPVLYVFTPLLSFADYQVPAWVSWLGGVTMAAGVFLFWRSHADLGANWSISLEIRREHTLVCDGVYRRVRHPMYTAIWLVSLAQALLLQNWLAGPGALATFAPLYFLRVPREEQMMRETFPEEYPAYMARTGRLWPRLGRAG